MSRPAGGVGCCALLFVASCTLTDRSNQKIELGVDPAVASLAQSAAFRETIGALTYYDGLGTLSVRGYGLVMGLGKNGSRECPSAVRDQLVQSIIKMQPATGTPLETKQLRPEQLIGDPDTAVVIVRGEIPPGAVEGTRFDVSVTALPGTQTRSLRGGRLFPCELEVFRETGPGRSISGRIVARASGPLFLNPFSEEGGGAAINPLEAVIIRGGRAVQPRDLRLVLGRPSYAMAQRVQDRINTRFQTDRKISDAVSPSFVELRIPRDFHGDTAHFLGLVRALFLSTDPSFEASRARALADEMAHPAAPHALISLALEGLGRNALPVLPTLYAHERDHVSFYAAAAGVRLGDHVAVDALSKQAHDSRSPYRFQAIRALGSARGMANAGHDLRELLNEEDPRVQAAAYEALIDRDDPYIRSTEVGRDNFRLDVVPTRRENMVYVKRTESRRVALLGDGWRTTPPLHYSAPDGTFVLDAHPEDRNVTLLRIIPATDTRSPPISAPFELPALVSLLGCDPELDAGGSAMGVGLDYAAVAGALYQLCHDQSINAHFVVEQPNVAELFGPGKPAGRPESELPVN